MEDDSRTNENELVCAVGFNNDSFVGFSLFELNGLPLNIGLNRSIIEISSSVLHGASIKLKKRATIIKRLTNNQRIKKNIDIL